MKRHVEMDQVFLILEWREQKAVYEHGRQEERKSHPR